MNEKIIQSVLLENKIRPNVKGYKYCFEILKILSCQLLQLKDVYETVAEKYGVKPNSIEKSVSNAIAKAFLDVDMQQTYEKLCLKTGKVNNKKFIDILKKQVLSHK